MGSDSDFCLSAPLGEIRDRKIEAVANLIRLAAKRPIQRMLVVGCGSGVEAAMLSKSIGAEVIGIDLYAEFDPAADTVVDLRHMDATSLQFKEKTFDYIFSYHVLEHILDYRKALFEMKRVLVEDGGFFIGTPNRSRMVGYIGSKDATLHQKIFWNLNDWSARAKGKFKNEHGAHAGFSKKELCGELQKVFGRVEDITLKYYQQIYFHRIRLLDFLVKVKLGKILFPSVYFIGEK